MTQIEKIVDGYVLRDGARRLTPSLSLQKAKQVNQVLDWLEQPNPSKSTKK